MRTYDAWFPRYALGNGLMFFCRVFSPAVGRGSSALLTFLDRRTQRVKEQYITIISILTGLGMTLGVLIEALLGGPSMSTSTSQSITTSDKKGGLGSGSRTN